MAAPENRGDRRGRGRRRQSDREVLQFADRIGVGIFILRGHRFHYANQPLCELVGLNAAPPGALSLADLVDPAQRPELEAALEAVQAGRSGGSALTVGIPGIGDGRWLDLTLRPLPLGEDTAVLGTAYDVTERVRSAHALARTGEALRRAMHDAEAASRSKSAFLAAMSHEMRTPLNAVLGMVEVLGDTSLNAEQRDHLAMMDRAGHALMVLINDILDLAKVEAGQFELYASDFDLEELLEEVLDFHRLDAARRGLELAFSLDAGLATGRRGDRARLRQVLLNLVGNALKFTEAGAITVQVAAEAGGALRFTVRDTGVGIGPEFLDRIFDAFVQADSSPTRRRGGAGLGLAICKRLVELMGGHIGVDSTPGRGSTFHFTAVLPDAGPTARREAPPALGESALAGVKALVVDDIAVNRLFSRVALAPHGAQVDEAAGAGDALALLEAALRAGTPYALLLSDYRMPDIDGLALVRRYCALPGAQATAVIMLSSEQNDDTEAWRAAGVDEFLVKPVKRAELLGAVARRLVRAPVAPAATPRAAPMPAQGPPTHRILLAEDNADNRKLILAYLKAYPYHVDIAENGREAIDKFCNGAYDLALVDVQMPELDGLSAVRAIRDWERAQGRAPSPLLMLTSHALEEDVRQSLAAGANEHLAKPVRKKVLLDALARHLPSRAP